MNPDAVPPGAPILPIVDALTQGGDDAPALLVQLETDWSAVAVKPSGVLLVVLDASVAEPWEVVVARAASVIRTESSEVLAGLADGVMGVVLLGSPLGLADLAAAPPVIAELGRAVHWIVVSSQGATFGDPRPGPTNEATALFQELDAVVAAANVRALKAGVGRALRSDVERVGEEALAAEARFRVAMARRFPPVTVALLALCAVMFVLEKMWGAPASSYVLARMGAASGAAFSEGHVEVVLAYALLHGGPAHILMNGFALDSLGRILENLIGGKRFLVVFTLAALGGGIASVIVRPESLVVGASGGIFGLMLALYGLTLRKSGEVPTLAKQRLRKALGSTLLLNVVISLLPGVSLLGHAGGAVVGFVLAVTGLLSAGAPVPWLPPSEPARAARAGHVFTALAALCAIALVGSAGMAFARGRPWDSGPGAIRTVPIAHTHYAVDVPESLPRTEDTVPGTDIGHLVAGRLRLDPMLVEVHTVPLPPADVRSLASDQAMLEYFNSRKKPVEVVAAKPEVVTKDEGRWVVLRGKTKNGSEYGRWVFVDGATLVDAEALLMAGTPAPWLSAFSGAEPRHAAP